MMKSNKNINNIVSTKYWHQLENGKVQCDLCPRACKLNEGQRGMCFVRSCVDGAVVLNTYGRSSGFCIDPIEKKPLFHFFPGTPVLSFGTAGCNLACKFCQNWDISKSREMTTLADDASPTQIAQAAATHNCKSVAFTYNDPIIFIEYAIDVAEACHALGVQTIAVTSGYMCDKPRKEFYEYIDAANVDLKGFSERFYKEQCSGALQPVLDTLLFLKQETDVWFEITTLLIPGENDSIEELDAMTKWIVNNLGADTPIHFSAFHPAYHVLDKPRTPASTLIAARKVALKNGLRFAYTGNVHNEDGESTYCYACGKRIIGRDWYVMSEYNLTDDGQCAFCEAQIAGCFSGPAGDWGAKRLPVHIR
ncbi:AmmeMemoRadiSam system radical SAM enzyme [Oligoflexia bacterium]|nr:AmmeMemoRadiSam system radical SAM enzyme [Oligoflexia bacterium]